jgi:hypothetical protein
LAVFRGFNRILSAFDNRGRLAIVDPLQSLPLLFTTDEDEPAEALVHCPDCAERRVWCSPAAIELGAGA